jgi:hypothetical protein
MPVILSRLSRFACHRLRRKRLGVRQLARALVPQDCSRRSEPGVVPGQQAGLLESGSKLPHSKALRAFSSTLASRTLMEAALRITSSQNCATASDVTYKRPKDSISDHARIPPVFRERMGNSHEIFKNRSAFLWFTLSRKNDFAIACVDQKHRH